MPDTTTEIPIATQTLSSAQSTVTFSSIPATYTDLVLIMNLKGSTTGLYPCLQFNSDTAANYSQTGIYGTGSAAGSQHTSNSSVAYITSGCVMSNTEFNFNSIVNLQNYSNSTTNKTILSRSNNAASEVNNNVILWRSNSAITRIDILCYLTGSFAIGSTFTLYGIL
jgi:hypothetical protein